jgi:hypothetical protein
VTTPNRWNPTDDNYELLKRLGQPAVGLGNETISFTPGDPAGWFEADPALEGGLIYHPPTGVTVDADNLVIPWSSNFVPDPQTPGAGVVLQVL